ncbi:methyltransferase domain-containing protein [Lacibacterium aquatile]|uniref:Methyltransferase domain-containing protein n=1 Tax=Lacibacterium aquatile TaxID=1168082 RepID=A0ABW5DKX0_9PROT
MSGFSSQWLALREPADLAARAPGLLTRLRAWGGSRDLRVMDLGAGTGSTLRSLEATLPLARWVLADADLGLLLEAKTRHPAVETAQIDLSGTPLPAVACDLVTASALLDLVSEEWLDRFCDALSARNLPLYAALNYDGVMEWHPVHHLDVAITTAFNRHQQTDKGLGPALGPLATEAVRKRLEAVGYSVDIQPSPWRLRDTPLHAELLEGIATAVGETGQVPGHAIADWLAFRRLNAGEASIGHWDLLALPS